MTTGTTETTEVRSAIRNYIADNLLYMHPDLEVQDSDDLLSLGVIDSLGFVELVEDVQSRYGIEVQDLEITEDNFGSVDAIVAFIGRKRAA